MKPLRFTVCISATLALLIGPVQAETTLTIATVNNADMAIMQQLSTRFFEEQYPDIKLDWRVFSENEIRQSLAKSYLKQVGQSAKQRLSESPPPGEGQFDIVTIGTYDVPIWIRWGWLVPLVNLPDSYDEADVLESIHKGLAKEGTLYALPFYGESSMTFYRTDLIQKAGIDMPANPTYQEIAKFAAALYDPDNEVYGICLRGKIGWGENMAYVSTLVNTFGGRWFDEQWNTTIDTPQWKEAIGFYIDLLKNYGPPSATENSYNENLQLFAQGRCGMLDRRHCLAAEFLVDPTHSVVADKVEALLTPVAKTPKDRIGYGRGLWLSPVRPGHRKRPSKFIAWATSKDYIELVGRQKGWAVVPPGTRQSTYVNPNYTEAAPFAEFVLGAIRNADPVDNTLQPTPYGDSVLSTFPDSTHPGTQVRSVCQRPLWREDVH
ncbi:MAG: extracellular solute-binding protein [Candidatus Competibacteraceae bacterium]